MAEPSQSGDGLADKMTLPTSEQASDCPPVGKNAKSRKKRQLPNLPTGGQNDLRSLMPTLPTGFWWECPADDKGFKLKLRWRGGQAPHSFVFSRVGKTEFQALKELNDYDRKWTIADRIKGELIRKGRRELAARIGLIIDNNQQSL